MDIFKMYYNYDIQFMAKLGMVIWLSRVFVLLILACFLGAFTSIFMITFMIIMVE